MGESEDIMKSLKLWFAIGEATRARAGKGSVSRCRAVRCRLRCSIVNIFQSRRFIEEIQRRYVAVDVVPRKFLREGPASQEKGGRELWKYDLVLFATLVRD